MSAQNLYIDFKSPKTPAVARRYRMVWTDRIRHLVQFGFAAFILYMSVAHNLATEDGAVASIDALCPFGAVETFYRWITSGGQYVPKTHLSNLVLGIGLLIGVLFAGGAFCGWVCPFGATAGFLELDSRQTAHQRNSRAGKMGSHSALRSICRAGVRPDSNHHTRKIVVRRLGSVSHDLWSRLAFRVQSGGTSWGAYSGRRRHPRWLALRRTRVVPLYVSARRRDQFTRQFVVLAHSSQRRSVQRLQRVRKTVPGEIAGRHRKHDQPKLHRLSRVCGSVPASRNT